MASEETFLLRVVQEDDGSLFPSGFNGSTQKSLRGTLRRSSSLIF